MPHEGTAAALVVVAIALSAQASSSSPAAGPPGPPLSPVAKGWDSAVNLSWQPPANDNGSPVIMYKVYLGTDPGLRFFAANSTSLSLNVTGLQNGKKYFLSVSAMNVDGVGPNSTIVSATPRPPGSALAKVVIGPQVTSLYVGERQKFEATVYDALGFEVGDATLNWSVNGTIGTIAPDGSFTATAAGKGEVRAEATRGDDRASGSMKLEVKVVVFDVAGQVKDRLGNALDNATVYIAEAASDKELGSQVTVSNGGFTFHVPSGEYRLFATAKGFDGKSYSVTVQDAPVTGIVITLARPGEEAPQYSLYLAVTVILLVIIGVVYMILVRAGRRRRSTTQADEDEEEDEEEAPRKKRR